MNYIQKAWLWVLSPVTPFINEKLAKRSGILGKIGRFFVIGPRQYGFHPTNKMAATMNQIMLQWIGLFSHRYSTLKAMTHNGYNVVRLQKQQNILIGLSPFIWFFLFFLYYGQMLTQDYQSLNYLGQRKHSSVGIPSNAMQRRVSAHYIEINRIYGAQMAKLWEIKKRQIISDREQASDQQKHTKYASSNYKYIPMVKARFQAQE